MSLGILVVSSNRPSLRRTLESIERGMTKKDKVIVVMDGTGPPKYHSDFDSRFKFISEEFKGSWGHPHREKYQTHFEENYILNVDDDDELTQGWRKAIEVLTRREDPDLIIFNYLNLYTGVTSLRSSKNIEISPITGNVLFKSTKWILDRPWKNYVGADCERVLEIMKNRDVKVYYSDFVLFNKS